MTEKWKKITLTGSNDILNIITADIIQISGGMVEENNTHIHFIEIEDFEDINNKLSQYHVDFKFSFEDQFKEDWHLTWKDNFTSINFENKLTIIPDWKNSKNDGEVVKIKPGMAFGTGHHETTYLMLEQLLSKINPKDNVSVLDLGAGSGVLSISAKKLGADKVVAVEFDKECEDNFYENLELNNLTGEIPIFFEDVLKWQKFDFDIILANINKNVIVDLIPILSKQNVTEVLLTGLLIEKQDEIIALINKYDFQVNEIFYKGDWMLLSINKINSLS